MKKVFSCIPLFVTTVLLSLLMFSCGNSNQAGENEVVVEGRFIHSRANAVFVEVIHVENVEKTDSFMLDEDGSFSFRYKTDKPVFLKFSTAEDNFITILAEPGQTISLSGDINALAKTYSVSGSPASELVATYLEFTRKQYEKLDTLALIWENNKYAENKMIIRDSIDSLAKSIYKNQQNYVLEILHKNPESLGSLFVLYQYFGREPVLDPIEFFGDYEKLAKSLSVKYPNFEHVAHLNSKVNTIRLTMKEEEEIKARLDTGKVAPDFMLPDVNGNETKLSDFKGSVVLVHFWASWSPESIRQLAALRQYQQTYGPKGLVIVSVAFDYDKEMWTTAMEKEKIKWVSLSDLKHTGSPVAKLYHIGQVPYLYLLDRKGVIVNKSDNIDLIGNDIYKLFRAI